MNGFLKRLRGAFDDPNPIVVKELRSVFRTKLYVRFLYLSAFAIGALVLLIGATIVDGRISPAEAGRVIYQSFFSLCVMVLSVVGPIYGASSITSEREGLTYESLLLTGMDPARIVVGKLWAAYASLALVLVALSPIGGVVFLFGGVAPSYVLVAFASVLVLLLPAVAYGVSVSAHVPTSRLAILVVLGTWPLVVFFGFIGFTIFGEEMRSTWDIDGPGPFWFAEVLVERGLSLDTFFAVGVLPLCAVVTCVWFFVASAIAGVRPAAEDRSTPLKVWALASMVCPLVLVSVASGLAPSHDVRDVFALILGFFFVALYVYVNIFVNEPPLPPRSARAKGGALRESLRRTFGPGARPTMRFGVWFTLAATALMVGVFAVVSGYTGHARADDVLGFAVVGASMAIFACFLLALGTLVRIRTRSGGTARAVLLGTVAALVVLPSMTAIILDPRVFDDLDRHIPLVLSLSPLAPLSGAVMVASRRTGDLWMLGFFAAVYATLALALYVSAARRTREIIEQVAASRAALESPASEPSASEPQATDDVAQTRAPAEAGE
ncbi:MAG: hypothetical protein R3B40_09925 [Polyangiales bacterium]|nr:hypothetical protein [Myxococcales bacterium]MCB9657897.1 hypothetical protein [Sandaracinaceae bacterium]